MKIWQAVLVVALVVGFFAADEYYFHLDALAWTGKQLLRMTDWLAFWR
ncbi:hypothetical protein [Algicella marina]|uniref:Uncharacterized protein n=1 Tax=Algicella marina TaxID=2683284 RepID=A0A6P1SYX8_9RHOB|nr:hypothetical protein [Algicella marina]QHQ34573.1 hypothetical protein GO499_04895 [Algicella marina]